MISKSFSNNFVTILFLGTALAANASGFDATEQLVHEALARGSVESFLHALPFDLRDNYVLGRRPLGSHVGSPKFPRGLLFGPEVIVSFGACPGSEGHDHVEMMDLSRLRPELIDVSLERGQLGFRRNPVSCQHCHGTMNRPLWPTEAIAPGWPGFYGAGVSNLTAARESELLVEFKQLAVDHPRYSALVGLPRLEAYNGRRGKSLYAANKKFEEIISRAVARNTFDYLRNHPNYARARLPLLVALNVYKTHAFIDLASAVAPWVGQPEDLVREALLRHELRVRVAIDRHAWFKWQMLEHALAMKFSNDQRRGFEDSRTDRLLRLGTLISWLSELYGMHRLETYLSTSRQPDTFAFPGHPFGVSGPSLLERILFRDALAKTSLTDADVARNAWDSPRDLMTGLGRLALATGHALPCDFHFRN